MHHKKFEIFIYKDRGQSYTGTLAQHLVLQSVKVEDGDWKLTFLHLLNAPTKECTKVLYGVYKDAKRPYKEEKDTKNNTFSLLRAQSINKVHHGH